jgi:hypothetical protein
LGRFSSLVVRWWFSHPNVSKSWSNLRSPEHFVKKAFDTVVETVFVVLSVKFDKLQCHQPVQRGRVNEVAGNFWSDPSAPVFKKTLQSDPKVRLKNSEKAVFGNLH